MKSQILVLVASLLYLATGQASAQTLSVGDDAPALEVSRWVKGQKIAKLEKNQTYVVEFWATWCGPCRTSIPHLTELQKRYKEKGVTFIGVSVWEGDQAEVDPFVKEMGDKMDYAVALDDVPKGEDGNKGKMAKSWMTASESGGIPTAFIVKNGKVAWIGHPMELEPPLEKVLSPSFDLAKATSEFREEKAKEKKLMAIIQKVMKLGQDASDKERLAIIDKAIQDSPELEPALGAQKYAFMFQSGDAGASAYGTKLVEGSLKEDVEALNEIAWMNLDPENSIADSKRDIKLALKAATQANVISKGENGATLDTLALAYFKSGEIAKAVEAQEKAVKLSGSDDEAMNARLKQYRKAAAEKKP